MHASIGGESSGDPGYRLERERLATARFPSPTTDAAGVPRIDLIGIDRVVRTFYLAIAGAPQQWRSHQLRALFERRSFVRAGDGTEIPVEEYIRWAGEGEPPRTLVEIDRAIRVDGAIAFVASAYHAFASGRGAPVLRVNEFLLRKAEGRWRITGMVADHRHPRHGRLT